MTIHCPSRFARTAAFALLAACAVAAAAPVTAASKAGSTAAAQSGGQTVDYPALEDHVGAEIVVETTLNTVRQGVLVKYTNPTLTIQLGPEHGSIELSVPHDTVRRIRMIKAAAAAQPQADARQEQGNRSAQKN